MKITLTEPYDGPAPGFLVEAENDAERLVLKAFVAFHRDGKQLTLRSWGGMAGRMGVESFHFGWRK